MSQKALALIFLNLGGEMLYVLDQRLYAQKIQVDKGKKIMQDIVTNMFSERFLDEIFKPQEVCSRKALRTIFERLAHTSIMRLNESSMDKLYDLMTMAVKYQILLITKPKEILLVTLNHLDSILPFITDSDNCVELIEKCYKRIFKTYSSMTNFELQFIRQTMLSFFQDLRIKVSVFLKEKVQNWNGSFILFHEGPVSHGADVPGTITYYEKNGNTTSVYKESKFNPGSRYLPAEREGSYERNGDRIIKLGLNVYSSNKPVDTIVPTDSGSNKGARFLSDYESMIPDPKSKAQLDLLCRLIGKSTSASSAKNTDFKLNLFNNEEEEFIYNTQIKQENLYEDRSNVVSFDASKRQHDDRLSKVMSQFSSKGNRFVDDDDLKKGSKLNKNTNTSRYKNENEDDDDDIVAIMDRINRK